MRGENQGARSYFRGNGVNVLKNVPESALKLAVNDRGQRTVLAREREKMATTSGENGGGSGSGERGSSSGGRRRGAEQQQHRRLTVAERLAIGGAAGGVAQILIYPLEVIQTRLAAPASLLSNPSSFEPRERSFSSPPRLPRDPRLRAQDLQARGPSRLRPGAAAHGAWDLTLRRRGHRDVRAAQGEADGRGAESGRGGGGGGGEKEEVAAVEVEVEVGERRRRK